MDTKWIFEFVFQCFSLSNSIYVFDNKRQYLYPQRKQAIMNPFKSFLSLSSDQLFNVIIANNALKPFNSISTNNF
jgi:hypothetical protein